MLNISIYYDKFIILTHIVFAINLSDVQHAEIV